MDAEATLDEFFSSIKNKDSEIDKAEAGFREKLVELLDLLTVNNSKILKSNFRPFWFLLSFSNLKTKGY